MIIDKAAHPVVKRSFAAWLEEGDCHFSCASDKHGYDGCGGVVGFQVNGDRCVTTEVGSNVFRVPQHGLANIRRLDADKVRR